jgi:hypothetical protein
MPSKRPANAHLRVFLNCPFLTFLDSFLQAAPG